MSYDSHKSKALVKLAAEAGDRATLAELNLANQLAAADVAIEALSMRLARQETLAHEDATALTYAERMDLAVAAAILYPDPPARIVHGMPIDEDDMGGDAL